MPKQFILNKNKSIGKVIYIVEGNRKEFTLLSHIFTKILNYSVIHAKRQEGIYEKYISAVNPDSQVYIINSETSNIGSLKSLSGKDYLDTVFRVLYDRYQLDTTNAATYYILTVIMKVIWLKTVGIWSEYLKIRVIMTMRRMDYCYSVIRRLSRIFFHALRILRKNMSILRLQ